MAISKEKKIEKGFLPVIVYYANGNPVGVSNYCARKRYYIEGRTTEDLDSFIHIDKVRGKRVVMDIDRSPNEYEYIWYTLIGRGAISVEFVNEYEVSECTRYISDRGKESLTSRMEKVKIRKLEEGRSVFSSTPYGYYVHRKKVVADPYEEFVVKYIFFRKNQGAGLSETARELNNRGFQNRAGRRFSRAFIRRVLDNERIYQGYISYLGKEYKVDHKAFLDESGLTAPTFKNKVSKRTMRKERKNRNTLPRELRNK